MGGNGKQGKARALVMIVGCATLGSADEFLMLNKEHIRPIVGEPGKALGKVMTSNGEI